MLTPPASNHNEVYKLISETANLLGIDPNNWPWRSLDARERFHSLKRRYEKVFRDFSFYYPKQNQPSVVPIIFEYMGISTAWRITGLSYMDIAQDLYQIISSGKCGSKLLFSSFFHVPIQGLYEEIPFFLDHVLEKKADGSLILVSSKELVTDETTIMIALNTLLQSTNGWACYVYFGVSSNMLNKKKRKRVV